QQTLHIAIYDFRLEAATAGLVIPALKQAAERGVEVRIAYDHQHRAKGQAATAVEFETNDPKPRGTHDFLQQQFAGSQVEIAPVESSKLMHNKYVLRDSFSDAATVWTGSANFTDDAWTYQENNILTLQSTDLARYYETDFNELWAQGTINGTGKNLAAS